MNTFKRLSDIISANLNSALDKAENPEKMLDLSIRKLEETRAKIRAEIADRNTEKDTYAKHMSEKRAEAARWETRAELSISKGRDDMAREAIAEKLEAEKEAKKDEETITTLSSLVAALQETLARTEEKLEEMKYFYSFCLNGCLGFVKTWLEEVADKSPEHAARLTFQMVVSSMKAFYETAEEPSENKDDL